MSIVRASPGYLNYNNNRIGVREIRTLATVMSLLINVITISVLIHTNIAMTASVTVVPMMSINSVGAVVVVVGTISCLFASRSSSSCRAVTSSRSRMCILMAVIETSY